MLRAERGIGFKEMVELIHRGNLIDAVPHPDKKKYPCQKMYVVNVKGYIYMVPYVEEKDGGIFLKTLYPSRKATKKYLEEQ